MEQTVSRLVRVGAIREAIPGYYLDEAIYYRYAARRRRNMIVIVAVLAVAAGFVIWLANPR